MGEAMRNVWIAALTLALYWTPAALGGTVSRAAAARLTPTGLDLMASFVSGASLPLPDAPVSFPLEFLGCDYTITVSGFGGEVQMGEVYLQTEDGDPGQLSVVGMVDSVELWDAVVVVESPDWWCVEYNEDDQDVIVTLLRATDASLVLNARAEAADGGVSLEVAGGSSVNLGIVEVDTTPWFIPDALLEEVLEWFQDDVEDRVLEAASDLIGEAMLELAMSGELLAFAYGATVDELDLGDAGADVVLGMSLDYVGDPGECAGGETLDDHGEGDPVAFDGDDGDLHVVVTEQGLNAALDAVWAGGVLCGAVERLDLSVAAALFPALGGVEATVRYDVTSRPTTYLQQELVFVMATSVGLTLDSPDGPLLTADVLADVALDLILDHDLGVFAVTIEALQLEFGSLDASGLLLGTTYTEEDLLQIVEDQVLPLVVAQVVDFPIAPLKYGVTGLDSSGNEAFPDEVAGELLRLEVHDGSVYAVIDASFDVDTTPPTVEILTDLSAPLATTDVSVEFEGWDEQSEALLYSWRVDGSPWTLWGASTTASFTVVAEGDHLFEVMAKDDFFNESAVASAGFTLSLPPEDLDEEGGCSCSAAPVARGPAAALLIAGVLLVRRMAGGR